MRYLKPYKIFESENYLDNESINWDLINNAKDLALDKLDEGLSLDYKVDYIRGGGLNPIIIGEYSHEKDKLDWKWKGNSDLIEDYISYSFFYNKVDNYVDYAEESEELIDTLKVMFPDAKINNDRWANYGPVQALRQHLISDYSMDESDIYSITYTGYSHYNGKVYEYDGMEFISLTYDEAMESAKQYVNNLDDEGILNVDLYFRFDCVDEHTLAHSLVDEEMYRHDWKYYGIKENENGDMDEESFENFMESEIESIKYDVKDYIESNFGDSTILIIKDHLTNDWLDKMTEGVVSADGLGHSLSGYDGLEHIEEYDSIDYYIFRIN